MATLPPPEFSTQNYTRNNALGLINRFKSCLRPSSADAGDSAGSAPSSPSATSGPATNIHPASAHSRIITGTGTPNVSAPMGPNPVLAAAGTIAGPSVASKIEHTAVLGLKSALQTLYISAGVIPSLKPAISELIGCLETVHAATSSAEEYEEIISNLNVVADSLKQYLSELGLEDPSSNPACARIASNIEKEVVHIKEQQSRIMARRALESAEDRDDVVKCYRRVEALFQQLHGNICLQTLKNTNVRHQMSLLERLCPVADARYDSGYSATVRRHGCTKEARIQIQADLQHWVQDPHGAKVYWMNGMAGTGKTTIAYSLCEWLETQRQLGASFFCSRLSSSCRNVSSIIPTVAYELANYSPAFRAKLGKVLEQDPNASTRDVDRQFEKLLQGPVGAVEDAMPHGVVVVIDALDECEDVYCVELILQALLHLGTNLPLKFFVASRPEPAILEKMIGSAEKSRAILHLHDIEQSIVEGDIKKYLEEGLGRMIPPPDVKQIEQLARRAGKLFIYAATVTRYILPGVVTVNSAARLEAVMAAGSSTMRKEGSGKKYKQLDDLYSTVLATPLDEEILEPEEIETARLVLWTVVCAKEPMTVPTLASFLSLNETQVMSVIKALRSVLHVSERNWLVSTLHASFPDYMLDHSRSGKYYCDPLQHNELLMRRCFDIMKVQLRFNICNLQSSSIFDKDLVDLEQRMTRNISCELSYACLYWGEHLHQTGFSDGLRNEFLDFLSCRLLFWMEVLSLKQRIGHGETMLSRVLDSLSMEEESTKLRDFTYDARNFLTTFAGNPASQSTPHIYLSALPFLPKRNYVQKAYLPRTQGLVRIEGAIAEGRVKFPLATWDVGSRVDCIARSSDGKRIASGSWPNKMSIWDVSNGARINDSLKGHQTQVWAVAFSPDNTYIASGSADHTIRLWDALNGSIMSEPLYGHTAGIRSVTFSPDGSRLASGSEDHTIRMWDARTGGAIGYAYRGHEDAVLSVSFSPDGEHLASGSWDYTIRVWHCQAGLTLQGPMHGHSGAVYSVAYSPDGLQLASGSRDCTVRVWNMPSGTLLAGPFEGHTAPVSSVSFSSDNTRIVSSSWDKTIRMWEAESGNTLAGPFEGHNGPINAALFTMDGTRILSGSDDGTIRVWDARRGTTGAAKSSGHTNRIQSIALSPDGARIASSSDDRTICVWDTHNGALVAGPFKGHTGVVISVAFSPDGTRIVSGSSDNFVLIWEASTGNLLVGPIQGHFGSILSVAFSPDGRQIASGSDDCTARLWDSHTGKIVTEPFEGHTDGVTSIVFSPDGSRIVSGSCDRTVQLWVTNDGTALWTSNPHADWVNCVAFSPDGTRVVSGSADCTILVLDARDGAVLRGPFTGHTSDIYSVAFSPDGMRVVSGSRDETVSVWDVESGSMVAGRLSGHSNWVSSVAFSPDGARIFSGSADGTIRFWDISAVAQPDAVSLHNLSINRDGWLTSSDSQLLLWVPSALRRDFRLPSPSNPVVINGKCSTRIHNSILLFGDRWHECFHETPPPAA